MKYWPKPVQKSWLAVYCDGLCIGIMQENAAADREKKRLLGLKGISISYALPADLIKFHAATKLSSRILRVMSEKSVCYRWKPKFAKEFLKIDRFR